LIGTTDREVNPKFRKDDYCIVTVVSQPSEPTGQFFGIIIRKVEMPDKYADKYWFFAQKGRKGAELLKSLFTSVVFSLILGKYKKYYYFSAPINTDQLFSYF
jgi:hypothetical protein